MTTSWVSSFHKAGSTTAITSAAAAPTFAPVSGTVLTAGQTVTLTTPTPGASIHFTIDGTTPTITGPLYSGPITITTPVTLKAVAFAPGFSPSAIAVAGYGVQVATPTFAPPAGTYGTAQSVTISCSTPGSSIFFTIDGSTPTPASTHFTAPVTVSTTETIKAIATATGFVQSNVASALYTMTSGAALSITTTSPLPNAVQGGSYSQPLTATGGTPPYAWSLVSDPGSTNTWAVSPSGVVTGIPGTVESDTLNVKVTDSASPTPASVTKAFTVPVVANTGLPSAVKQLQLINQGGPNNGPTNALETIPGYTNQPFNSLGNHNYCALSWLPATPGANPIAGYQIFRNGVLYDTISTPRQIIGFIAPKSPTSATFGQGQLTINAGGLSGGTTAIANGDILCGAMLFSNAAGFNPNTVVNYYSAAQTGGGGVGPYVVNFSQTVGSAGAPATFFTWTYQDTQATGVNDSSYQTPGTVYAYQVAAVDSLGNVGPKTAPVVYLFRGISYTQAIDFSTNAATQYNSTAVAPSSPGPYVMRCPYTTAGGDIPFPVFGGNSFGALCPSQRLEIGAFNGFTFDVMVTDNMFQTNALLFISVMRAAGFQNSADTNHWSQVNLWSFGTPVIGQWATFRIPFTAISYGLVNCTASFVGTAAHTGTLSVSSLGAKTCLGIDGSAWVVPPGALGPTLANSYIVGFSQAGGPGPYTVFGPNITGTESIASTSGWQTRGTSAYKFGFQWNVNPSAATLLYFDNVGLYT